MQSHTRAAETGKKQQSFLFSFIHSIKSYARYYDLTLMFLPVVAYFLLFKYGPMYGLVLAFKDFKIKAGIWGSPWVGLVHFTNLFEALTFVRAVRNTIVISLLKLICGFPMPIILALMLNEVRGARFKKIVQTISYLPHFLSWVVLAGLFTQLLSPSNGAINYIIKSYGGDPIYFLADNSWFRFTLIITEIWKGVGWGSILYIATIAGINPEIYEAAECDGAGRFARMLYITLPELSSTITILLILRLGDILDGGFDQVFNLYNAAVYETGDIIDTYVYRRGLGQMQYSQATAVGLFKNLIGFGLVALTNAATKRMAGLGIW
jgi:putative aldouronate transport system permease protein